MRKLKRKIVSFLVIVVIIGALIFGAAMYVGCTDVHLPTKAKKGQVKVACVGDSITYGMSVINWFENTYPAQLGDMLGDDYHVQNFGFSAKTAQENNDESYRATKLYEKSKKYQPDIVILMLGSNDSKPYNFNGGKADFKQAMKELIEIYQGLESSPEIILATVNAGFYVHGANEGDYMYDINGANINIINQAIKELAEEYNLTLVDTFAITKDHPEWYKLDGIHPDKNGQTAMAEAFAEAVMGLEK